jgi:hypothetical protein
MDNIINLSDRRKPPEVEAVEPQADAQYKYVEQRKNLLDFLTTTQVHINHTPTITEAVIFLKDPATGQFQPGATSQLAMNELIAAMGSVVEIQAMPDGEDE